MEKKTEWIRGSRANTTAMVCMALMTAITCILAPLSVPVGPIPVSLTNLVLCFSVVLLGKKKASFSFLIYLLMGLAGVPVFSGFSAGPAKLVGPTGGYLLGFFLLTWIGGFFVERFPGKRLLYAAGMAIGMMGLYAFGTVWYMILMKTSDLWYALSVCVFPFLIFDAVKIAMACIVGETIRKRIKY